MGKYINRGNSDFAEARDERYVDKSALIAFVNSTLSSPARMTCVSHARRFGKSQALQMLYAYYGSSAEGAIAQVRERNYPQLVQEFTDRLLLVGINYNKRTKKHECRIERITKRTTNQAVADNKRITNGRQIELLTILRDGDCSMTELVVHFGYEKRESLKKAILGELLSRGLIEMTHPENPNHRSQRYRLTLTGRKEIDERPHSLDECGLENERAEHTRIVNLNREILI